MLLEHNSSCHLTYKHGKVVDYKAAVITVVQLTYPTAGRMENYDYCIVIYNLAIFFRKAIIRVLAQLMKGLQFQKRPLSLKS